MQMKGGSEQKCNYGSAVGIQLCLNEQSELQHDCIIYV